jgi:aspartate/methionine/tyrosine aminotransferase
MIIPASNRVQQVQTYYFARKLAEIAQMNKSGIPVINLGIGSPDLAPPEAAVKCLQKSSGEDLVNKYQSYKGIPELRSAFAKWYESQYNVILDPAKQVLPLIGSKEGIMHISMSFLNPGDKALVPNPGYPAYAMTARLAGAIPLEYNLTEKSHWLPNIKELAEMDLSNVKIMWLNYPHMPTGATASQEEFEQLVEFCQRHKILLCHDNPYSFILNENPSSIFSTKGSFQNCIELNSLSKCFNMAGWRVGVLVADEPYINSVMRFKSNMDSGMYKPIQLAAIEAMKSPKSWYEENNLVYAKRKELGIQLLESLGCEIRDHSAGFFLWAKLKDHSSAEDFVDRLLHKTRVFITPGTVFGTNGEGYIRLSLCSPESDMLQAIKRIGSFQKKEKITV